MADTSGTGIETARRGKILVVEDEQLVMMYIEDLLDDLGHRHVGTAGSMDEALEVASEEAPKLAIVDLHLSGEADGIAVATELVNRFGTAIIFMTGSSGADADRRMAEIRPVAILSKPCGHRQLAEAVKKGLAGDA